MHQHLHATSHIQYITLLIQRINKENTRSSLNNSTHTSVCTPSSSPPGPSRAALPTVICCTHARQDNQKAGCLHAPATCIQPTKPRCRPSVPRRAHAFSFLACLPILPAIIVIGRGLHTYLLCIYSIYSACCEQTRRHLLIHPRGGTARISTEKARKERKGPQTATSARMPTWWQATLRICTQYGTVHFSPAEHSSTQPTTPQTRECAV